MKIIKFSEELREAVKQEFDEKATPEFLNLLELAALIHERAFWNKEWSEFSLTKEEFLSSHASAWEEVANDPSRFVVKIGKAKFLEWIGKAWDAGIQQRKIYDLEEEGGIMNAYGVIMNFASYLYLLGEREGFILKED